MTLLRMADERAEAFGDSPEVWHYIPYQEQERLQIEIIQRRFAALREKIVPLQALADAGRIDRISCIEDIGAVLFPHSLFKSFPQHLLFNQRFDLLNAWIARLTIADTSAVDGRQFGSVDHWMEALDQETDLWMVHSSGTTGAMSLFPRSKPDWKAQADTYRATLEEWLDPVDARQETRDFAVIFPTYSGGRSAALRAGANVRESLTSHPQQFYTLLPTPLSTDLQLWMIEVDNARKRGAPPPAPSDHVQQRIDESNDAENDIDERFRQLLKRVREGIGSRRVIMTAGPINLHRVAMEALKQGMEGGLPKGSIIRSFGGLKGMAEPEAMEQTIMRFSGVDKISSTYGMSEITGGFNMCEHGHYHVQPWLVPLVVDPVSGALKPRKGKQRGLAAFMDLLPQDCWGGIISADMVEVSWDTCGCGRTTPTIGPTISRTPLPDGESHMPGPASAEALHAALYKLNQDIG